MKTKQLMPTCYFPTTTVAIDDNRNFLEGIRLGLDEDLAHVLFDSPLEALDYLSQYEVNDSFTTKCMDKAHQVIDQSTNGQVVNLNLDAIYNAVYNKDRFKEISTVVVDYSMPGMNGIEFLQAIKHMTCKKIMLTGQADQVLAVSAFNAGIIDKFILKSEVDVMAKVSQAIFELQRAYFLDASKSIYEDLESKRECCLNDKVFCDFFRNLCDEHHIAEYYLTQTPGSFLLLTMAGDVMWLLVKSSADMKVFYEFAKDYDAPEKVQAAIQAGTEIPHFWKERHFYSVKGRAWETFMHPAKKIEGDQDTYYYALAKDQMSSGLDVANVASYDDYLS